MAIIVKSDPRAREKPCLRCGLSLRKLLDVRHCPQCGLSVWLSLNNNDTLDWSNPAWLSRLALAALLMGALQALALLAWLIVMLPFSAPPTRYGVAAMIAGTYLLVYHAAALLLTTHENRYPDRLAGHRLAIRIVSAIAILAALFLFTRTPSSFLAYAPIAHPQAPAVTAEEELFAEGYEGYPVIAAPTPPWLLLIQAILAASAITTFAYFRKLAQRIPNSTAARLCGYVLLAPAISFILAFPFLGFCLAARLLWAVNYLPVIYYPFTAGLMIWFALAFRRSARHAAEGWGKETVLPQPSNQSAVAVAAKVV